MSNFVRIKTNGGTIEINPLQIPSIIVREIQQPKGFVVNMNIMPGKALYLETEGKTVFETKVEAEAAKDLLTTELNAAMGTDTGGTPAGKLFNRVRIFSNNNKLVTTQMVQEGGKVEKIDKQGYLFNFGTRNLFDYDTIITEDIDLTYSIIPLRYIQTTLTDFDENGDYIGTEEYIILPEDKPDGYNILNENVKGVATNGDYLTSTVGMFASYEFSENTSLYLELDYLDTSNVTNMSYMFAGSPATELDLSNFDTSNVTNMTYMFAYSQATTLDLSSFDTRNVTDMEGMFDGSPATTLDLSNFDTSNVTNMRYMFQGSPATTLDLSGFDTSKVTDMEGMFGYSQATTIDLSSFDTSNVTNMNWMFQDSQATTGYARTQDDADNFNNSSNKPSTLNFVKGVGQAPEGQEIFVYNSQGTEAISVYADNFMYDAMDSEFNISGNFRQVYDSKPNYLGYLESTYGMSDTSFELAPEGTAHKFGKIYEVKIKTEDGVTITSRNALVPVLPSYKENTDYNDVFILTPFKYGQGPEELLFEVYIINRHQVLLVNKYGTTPTRIEINETEDIFKLPFAQSTSIVHQTNLFLLKEVLSEAGEKEEAYKQGVALLLAGYNNFQFNFNSTWNNQAILDDTNYLTNMITHVNASSTELEIFKDHYTNKTLVITANYANPTIAESAFEGWEYNTNPLVLFNLPNDFKHLYDSSSFYNTPTIDKRAFYGWTNNPYPIVLGGLAKIEEQAFEGWENTPYVLLKGKNIPTLNNANAFANQNNAPIYVPDNLVSNYKTAIGWSDLEERIKPISEMTNMEIIMLNNMLKGGEPAYLPGGAS